MAIVSSILEMHLCELLSKMLKKLSKKNLKFEKQK